MNSTPPLHFQWSFLGCRIGIVHISDIPIKVVSEFEGECCPGEVHVYDVSETNAISDFLFVT
jgi:hypothetical protein